ncbi:hypothetical protein N7467_005571 [Penicillium canescens]|nr:hypothetical protein N7467_005571 [Penicillium canescens]
MQKDDNDVCLETVALQGPVLADTLRNIEPSSTAGILLCIGLMGICEYPSVSLLKVSFPTDGDSRDLSASKRPLMAERPSKSKRLAPLRIAHFSDIHVDQLYITGANANCSKPMCCRNYTLADEPNNNHAPAGPFGDHNCGAPPSLEESMYAAIQEISPDFSIFTGDIVDHGIWNTSVDHNTMEIRRSYRAMANAGMQFVYSTLGNHEMSPANAFPPLKLGKGAEWLFKLASKVWSRFVEMPSEDIKGFGRYSVRHPGSNLRIIAINTNLYYRFNFWMYQVMDEHDPDGQLQWLVDELDWAERHGERVYIIGHMPMGSSDNFHDASNYFDQIINRYKSTISASFFGHTHLDQFQISYSDYQAREAKNAVSVSHISPSMAPLSGMPAFRIYTVDPITFGILDVETYIADMDKEEFQTQPVWTKSYSVREAYGSLVDPLLDVSPTSELTPEFFHNLTIILESDENAFQDYWARRTRGWNVQSCDSECRKQELCQLRAARSQDNCHKPKGKNIFGARCQPEASSAQWAGREFLA